MGHVLKFSWQITCRKCMNLFSAWGMHSKHLEVIIGSPLAYSTVHFIYSSVLHSPTRAITRLGSPPQTFKHKRPSRAKSLACTNHSASDFNDSQSIARTPKLCKTWKCWVSHWHYTKCFCRVHREHPTRTRQQNVEKNSTDIARTHMGAWERTDFLQSDYGSKNGFWSWKTFCWQGHN